MDSARPRRGPLKSHRPDWKAKLRTNCLRRVKKDRINLLWKIRAQGKLPANDRKKAESAVRNIFSDELQKLKQSVEGKEDQEMDVIWEYQGPQVAKPAEIDSEDILLEMERLLYEDLREESIRKELEALDEEDAYLAQAIFDHMQLNDKEEDFLVTIQVCSANTRAQTCIKKNEAAKTVGIKDATEQRACQYDIPKIVQLHAFGVSASIEMGRCSLLYNE